METSVHPQVIDLETVEGRRAYALQRLPEIRSFYLVAFDLALNEKDKAELDFFEWVLTAYTREAVRLVHWL